MFEPQTLGEIDRHRSAVRPDYLCEGFGTRRPLAQASETGSASLFTEMIQARV